MIKGISGIHFPRLQLNQFRGTALLHCHKYHPGSRRIATISEELVCDGDDNEVGGEFNFRAGYGDVVVEKKN